MNMPAWVHMHTPSQFINADNKSVSVTAAHCMTDQTGVDYKQRLIWRYVEKGLCAAFDRKETTDVLANVYNEHLE